MNNYPPRQALTARAVDAHAIHGAATGCVVKERSSTQVAEWNSNLNELIGRLEKETDDLLMRLLPVLRSEPTEARENGGAVPEPSLVPLANETRNHCRAIMHVIERIENAKSRVEI